ncbi:OstA-like_N domain-containing protein [Gammaproteobacteria bacterium]
MKEKSLIAVLVLFIAVVDISFALSANEKPATKLSSNSAICKRQNNENICTYLGNAKFNQGVTNLRAEQITIYRIPSGKINKIVASGEHSHYSTVMDNSQKPVDADANLITLYPDKSLMVLEGDGQVIAGQDKYSGPHIEYSFR